MRLGNLTLNEVALIMHTHNEKIDFLEIATEIAEWFERNYGYFVNKNSDKIKIIQDFEEQLKRLPIGAMSYIQQAKNNFIDFGNNRPPLPATFIKELRICFNKKVQRMQPVYFDKIKFMADKIYTINGDNNKIKYIERLSNQGQLIPFFGYTNILTAEIKMVLKRNNFTENKIREIIGS